MALLDDILRLFGTNRARLRWRWRALAERMTPRPPRKDAYKFDNKLCAGCGQPAGKDERACPSCGTPLPAIAVVRATRAIRWLIPAGVPAATMLLLAACGALYFVTVKASFAFLGDAAGRSFAPHWWILLRYGATEGGHLSQLGEWWRTVTACFLHFDALHILFNGIGLWIAGQVVEERFGWARALVVFVATGVAGNLVSAWWRIDRGELYLGAGASGAVFGLMGCIVGHALRRRGGAARELKARFVPWLIYGFIMGFAMKADNAAHLGGMAAGLAFGAVLGERDRARRVLPAAAWAVLAVLAALLVGASFYLAARHPPPPPALA